MNKMEKVYVPLMQKALKKQIDGIIQHIKRDGIKTAQGNLQSDIVNTNVYTVIRDIYSSAAKLAIKEPILQVKGIDVRLIELKSSPSYIIEVLRFLDRYLLGNVVLPISKTTIDEVDRVIREGLDQGLGQDEIVARLEASELTLSRARTIVRTEAHSASQLAQTIAADNLPYQVEKQWIAIEDNRTRLTHSNHGGVDGERVDLDQRYSNGLMYPGDKKGSAKEVINCRCTQGFHAKTDLEGNIIMKNPGDMPLIAKLEANLKPRSAGVS